MKPISSLGPSAWIVFAAIAAASAILWGAYAATAHEFGPLQLGLICGASTTSVLAAMNLCLIIFCRRLAKGQKAIQAEVYDDHRQIIAEVQGQTARVDDAYWRGYEDGIADKDPDPPFPPHRRPRED